MCLLYRNDRLPWTCILPWPKWSCKFQNIRYRWPRNTDDNNSARFVHWLMQSFPLVSFEVCLRRIFGSGKIVQEQGEITGLFCEHALRAPRTLLEKLSFQSHPNGYGTSPSMLPTFLPTKLPAWTYCTSQTRPLPRFSPKNQLYVITNDPCSKLTSTIPTT